MQNFSKIMAVFVLVFGLGAGAVYSQELDDAQIAKFSNNVIFGTPAERTEALGALGQRGNPDIAATLILAIRFQGYGKLIGGVLSALTGQKISSWNDGMLWQEANPQIIPHDSFRDLKLRIFSTIDASFLRFLEGERSQRDRMKIRLEEIAWGGVVVDGIPSLDNPDMIPAGQADYMAGDDLVFGVKINGDTRAYPLRIMGWHEMFNDTIGGVPVALAYCTLCGSGILFETQIEGRDEPLVFGSSGFLFRSNKLMFDRQTNSLWNQFTGKPVTGPLAQTDITLKILPVLITSWDNWKSINPDTTVLSLKTGYRRDYNSGVVYKDYFASPDLMFPAIVRDESVLKRKEYVFGIREFALAKAWPIAAFRDVRVINDGIGDRNLVLIGNAATRSVRAYERGDLEFALAANHEQLTTGTDTWAISEEALVAQNGTTLPRVPGHISYWFAWDGYMGVGSELYAK